jgi:hypothetical protein
MFAGLCNLEDAAFNGAACGYTQNYASRFLSFASSYYGKAPALSHKRVPKADLENLRGKLLAFPHSIEIVQAAREGDPPLLEGDLPCALQMSRPNSIMRGRVTICVEKT